MNLDRFDKITKDRCCILPVDIQLKTGYKTRKQFTSAINNIYKSVRNQRDFGGVALASAPLVNIARMMIEGTEEPIRVVNLIGEADPPIRPVEKQSYPSAIPVRGSGSTEPSQRELRLEQLLVEARSDTERRRVGEMTLEQMRQDEEERADEATEQLRLIAVAQRLSNNDIIAAYRDIMNLSEGSRISASFSRATKLQKLKILMEDAGVNIEGIELIESGIGAPSPLPPPPPPPEVEEASDDDDVSGLGRVRSEYEAYSEGVASQGTVDYPE